MPTNKTEYMRQYRRDYCKRKPEVCRKHTMTWRGRSQMIFKVPELEMRATITACEICGRPDGGNGKPLAVDHCHVTGHVRGLLCMLCNTALGKLQDSPDLLRKAIEYLEKPH